MSQPDRFRLRVFINDTMYDVMGWNLNDDKICFNDIAEHAGTMALAEWSCKYSDVKDRLIQCTGLRDKNGVLIYADDILHTDGFCADEFRNRIVKYLDGSFRGVAIRETRGAYLPNLNENWGIIGNIHENPELLRESDAGETP